MQFPSSQIARCLQRNAPTKSENRNPKTEGNPKSEARKCQSLWLRGSRAARNQMVCRFGFPRGCAPGLRLVLFGFRLSDFLRFSDFGLRISRA